MSFETDENTGRLVHVSSIAGHISAPISGFYSATKFALEAIADAQRRELLRWGISVSIIEPGYVQTPIEGIRFFILLFLGLLVR